MATIPPATQPGQQAPPTGLAGFFQPTPQQPPTPFEPPGFDLLRQLLMQKIFQLQGNPYNLTGSAAQNPQAPGSSGSGSAPMFSTGLNMNTPFFQGSFPGQGQAASMPWTSGGTPTGGVNPAMQQLGGAMQGGSTPQGAVKMNAHRVPISAIRQHFDALVRHFNSPSTTYTPIGDSTPPPLTMNDKKPQAPPPGGGNPMLAGLAQQNQVNRGHGPSTRAMQDNVGGGGLFGLTAQAGPSWQSQPQVNIPGLTYTGANHEWGGNPAIGQAGAAAGMTPQQMALWTLQGQLKQNPTWGGYLSGAGSGAAPIAGNNYYGGKQSVNGTPAQNLANMNSAMPNNPWASGNLAMPHLGAPAGPAGRAPGVQPINPDSTPTPGGAINAGLPPGPK